MSETVQPLGAKIAAIEDLLAAVGPLLDKHFGALSAAVAGLSARVDRLGERLDCVEDVDLYLDDDSDDVLRIYTTEGADDESE